MPSSRRSANPVHTSKYLALRHIPRGPGPSEGCVARPRRLSNARPELFRAAARCLVFSKTHRGSVMRWQEHVSDSRHPDTALLVMDCSMMNWHVWTPQHEETRERANMGGRCREQKNPYRDRAALLRARGGVGLRQRAITRRHRYNGGTSLWLGPPRAMLLVAQNALRFVDRRVVRSGECVAHGSTASRPHSSK